MSDERYGGPRQPDGWPQGVTENEKRVLTERARKLLREVPHVMLHVAVQYCASLPLSDWNRSVLLDHQYATVERALREAGGERVYALTLPTSYAPTRPTLESLTAALKCPECGATASQVVRRSVHLVTSPVLRVLARNVRLGAEDDRQRLEPEPLPTQLRCPAGHQYPLPEGMGAFLKVEA